MLTAMQRIAVRADNSEKEKKVKILFTHDIHSHLDAYKSENEAGDTVMIGGLAKLSTLIQEKSQENEATFLLDGGDFSMGTLYQTVYETEAAELTMLGKLGFDATTFGNHEFDYRSEGVANMFASALENAEEDETLQLPAFLIANIDWTKNTTDENMLIKEALDAYGSTPYLIIERGGVRIGIYGVLGEDAAECAPESGLVFDSIVDTSKEMVKQLQQEGVDMIVCLSHSGTSDNPKQSEDEILAKEVPEIDVIISAHTHTELDDYIQVGDTYIVSAACYAQFLGEVDLVQRENGRWNVERYVLNPVDESVKADDAILKELEVYKQMVNEIYLGQFGYTFDQVIAENDIEFTQMAELGTVLREETLGSVIADSYVYAVSKVEGENYEPVTMTVSPYGCIRDTLQKGELTVSDVFNVSALGIGIDRIPGYPLVSVYLTGKELKTVAEIDVSVSGLMPAAQLYASGVHWEYNSNRLILNRVTDVWIQDDLAAANSQRVELEDDKLYRVVADLYSAQMLGAVENTSMGILKIAPKDKNGNVIDNFEQYLVYDENGSELKAWYALAMYLESFEKNEDGISQIPVRYGALEGRKTDTDSHNFIDLVKRPNHIALAIYGVVLVIITVIVLIMLAIRKNCKRKKQRRENNI
ncbi:MAG: bifunctional metallophosphatase/5'-nucleotidase [Lachnospiraceae bacterium]